MDMRHILDKADVISVEIPLLPELEVSQYLHNNYPNLRNYPITVFNKILCKSKIPYVDNLLKRLIILDALDMNECNYLPEFCKRIDTLSSGQCITYQHRPDWLLSSWSLLDFPFLRYQPKDAGRYLTSFIFCIEDDHGRNNLGFYRGEIKNENTIAIFIDARTDASRILNKCLQTKNKAFISLFNGGPLVNYISAASKIPDTIDSYWFSNALSKFEIKLFKDEPYPAVPTSSEIVLYGYTEGKKIIEGPFCEFKGYYSDQTYSYEFKIDKIYTREHPYFFGIFCGKESGLNLMQFQNETFMYHHLIKKSFSIKKVIYPFDYFSEFGTIIETEFPSSEILKIAMEYDTRSKIFFVVRNAKTLFSDMAIFNFYMRQDIYLKRGIKMGERIGILVDNDNQYEWAEY